VIGHYCSDKCTYETCQNCGLRYCDWEDFSGPAHGVRDCISGLCAQLAASQAEVERQKAIAAELAAALEEHDSLLAHTLNVQNYRCDHSGIGKPGCVICDARIKDARSAARAALARVGKP
jgi:hypothetical protein